jgi:hypothetical protein
MPTSDYDGTNGTERWQRKKVNETTHISWQQQQRKKRHKNIYFFRSLSRTAAEEESRINVCAAVSSSSDDDDGALAMRQLQFRFFLSQKKRVCVFERFRKSQQAERANESEFRLE